LTRLLTASLFLWVGFSIAYVVWLRRYESFDDAFGLSLLIFFIPLGALCICIAMYLLGKKIIIGAAIALVIGLTFGFMTGHITSEPKPVDTLTQSMADAWVEKQQCARALALERLGGENSPAVVAARRANPDTWNYSITKEVDKIMASTKDPCGELKLLEGRRDAL